MRYKHTLQCDNCFRNTCELTYECNKRLSIEELYKMFNADVCCRTLNQEESEWRLTKVKVLWWKR